VVEAAVSRRVVVVWLVLAGLAGLIAVTEYRDLAARAARPPGEVDPRLLLPVPVERLGAIEVAEAGTLHRFERDAGGAWFYHGRHTGAEGDHTHQPDPLAAGRIERALQAFGRTRVERQLAREGDGTAYGLVPPRLVILAYRPGERQPFIQYAVGDVAPDALSRYVEVVGGPGLVTIPNYQIENLQGLIAALGGEAGR
jgi:hypothetical protein